MFYRFDINKWILHALPPVLRKPVIYRLLKALLYPLKALYGAFYLWKRGTDRSLSANAFTGNLERHLNSLFYLPEGEIYITDYYDADKVYLSKKEEIAEIVYVGVKGDGDFYLPSTKPAALQGVFVVNVPEALASPENIALIRREVDRCKYAGTKYMIKTY